LPKSNTDWLSIRNRQVMAVAAGVALCIVPTRLSGVLNYLGNAVDVVVQPVQWGFGVLLSPLTGGGGGGSGVDANVKAEIDLLKTRILQVQQENAGLLEQIRKLQQGAELKALGPTPRVFVPVTGVGGTAGSPLIKVRTDHIEEARAGERGPVLSGAVAVTETAVLVGRLTTGSKPFAFVQPISDVSSGDLKVVLMTGNEQSQLAGQLASLGSRLRAGADGMLRGAVYRLSGSGRGAEGNTAREDDITPGMLVRLLDERWPRHAQMLIVGEVIEVERGDNARAMIAVRPRFELRSLAELVLVMEEGQGEGSAGRGEPGGGNR
jgi:hypothetical protein